MKKNATPLPTFRENVVIANTNYCVPQIRALHVAQKVRPLAMACLALIACMTLFNSASMATALTTSCASWSLTGGAAVSSGVGNTPQMAVDASGTPYVVFQDPTNNNTATIRKYSGGSWASVGSSSWKAGAYAPAIAVNSTGTPYVAYRDSANSYKVSVIKYNGTSWGYVGSAGFSDYNGDSLSIAIDGTGTPYVAYLEDSAGSGIKTVRVFKYNGTSWAAVGANITHEFSTYTLVTGITIKIGSSNTPYVAYYSSNGGGGFSDGTQVVKFDGTNWVPVGSVPVRSLGASLAFNASGTPYISFVNGNSGYLPEVMSFDGSNWNDVGSLSTGGFFSSGFATSLGIDGSGNLNLGVFTYQEGPTPGSYTYYAKYSSGSWTTLNPANINLANLSSQSLAVSSAGKSYVVINDGTDNTIDLYELNQLLAGPITGPSSVVTGANISLADTAHWGEYTWSSDDGSIASIDFSGNVIGGNVGTTTVSYTVSTFGCTAYASKVITVTASAPVSSGLCVGSTQTLTPTGSGGTWSSSNSTIASVSTAGVVTGVAAGTATISYNVGTTHTTQVVTVNALPGTIQGATSVCLNATTTLSDVTASGIWSTSNGNATVDASGVVTGAVVGSSTISYTTLAGCSRTYPMTVKALPSAIYGTTTLCVGGTTTLVDTTVTANSWTSSNTSVATAVNSGVVTGVGTGTATITYKILTGCTATTTVTVQAVPSAITGGSSPLCVGVVTALTDASGAGTWSSSNVVVLAVNSSTGEVRGIIGGTARVSYLPTGTSGCTVTTVITVNTVSAISGTATVCSNLTTSLSDATTGGTWVSDNTSAANISSTGIVSGVAGGTTTITYTAPSTCIVTKVVTVNAAPTAILGATSVCNGSTTTLSDATTGGTWSSSLTGHATIGGTTGLVTGAGVGTTNITYTAGGCYNTISFNVNVQPGAVLGTKSLCAGTTVTLSNATAGGSWTSTGTATIGSSTGVVTAGSVAGTTSVVYTMSTGCNSSAVVTVNAIPDVITGTTSICGGNTTTLTDAVTGGTWSSSNTTVATVGSTSGIVTGGSNGTASITYTMPGNCFVKITMTVTAPPTSILGTKSVCQGLTTTLSDATASGVWSGTNSVIAVGSTGIITGTLAGTATVQYTVGAGCSTSAVVTVNALPGDIAANFPICAGTTETVTSTGTGTWATGNAAIATIGSASGTVSAVAAGTVNITYKLTATGCITTSVVTVNPNPLPIQGTTAVCQGATVSLSDLTTGGSWSSTANASIDGSGNVTGTTVGTATINYMILATGCYVTNTMTVRANPSAMLGIATTCVGGTTVFSDTTSGALSYTSSNTAVATIDNSGTATGIATGTATITYKIVLGCITTTILTVNDIPAAIDGATPAICPNSSRLLEELGTGTWSSSNTAVGTIGTDGTVTGVAGGTTTISFIPTATSGCLATAIVTVTPAPPVTGPSSVCIGGNITLTDATSGTWVTVDTTASVNGATGVVTGISAGTAVISFYTDGASCLATKTITVNSLPTAILGTDTVCANGSITLTDAATGGNWTSGTPGIATVGSTSGTVSGVAAGTVDISYTTGGCSTSTTVTVMALPVVSLTGATCSPSLISMSSSSNFDSVVWKKDGSVVKTTYPGPSYTYNIVTIGNGGLVQPTGTFITPGGDLYVTNNDPVAGGQILKFPAGFDETTTGVVVAQNGIPSPYGVFVDASGNIYVSDNFNNIPSVVKYPAGSDATTTGTVVAKNGLGGQSSTLAADVSVDAAGNVFVADFGNSRVVEYPAGSDATTAPTAVAVLDGGISSIYGLCVVNDTIYAADFGFNVVMRYDPLGGFGSYSAGTVVAGDYSSGSGAAQLWAPTGVALDNAGNIYVSDMNNSRVQKFPRGSAQGTNAVTVAGGNGYGPAANQFELLLHIAVDASNNMYIADLNNNRVQAYIYTPAPGTANSDTLTAGSAGSYVATFTNTSGCTASSTPLVVHTTAAITGTTTVCAGSTTSLFDATTGGTWTSLSPGIANVGSTGVVSGGSAGSAVINYTANGCTASVTVVVNPTADAGIINGASTVNSGSSISLSDATSGGSWSSTNTAAGSVDGSGNVTGITAGTTTISYTVTNSCGAVAATKVVTVANPALPAIDGAASMCIGFTITLSDATTGGNWTSANTAIATVGGTTGIVTGVTAGTVNITYTQGGSYATAVVTVNANPLPIQGVTSECVGTTFLLTDGTSGGSWSSNNSAIGSVDASGNVTGVAAGATTISYTLSATSCYVTYPMTVKPNPSAIYGTTTLCAGGTTTLIDTTANPISWTSSNTSVATVDNSATVTGIGSGTAIITYKVLSGCITTTTVSVNVVTSITGGTSLICPGIATALSASGSGAWSSSNTAVATVGTDGSVTGNAVGGTARISFTPTATSGCVATIIVTIGGVPSITGPSTLCSNATITLGNAATGGTWNSSNGSAATINSSTGVVTGAGAGVTNIGYTTLAGCVVTTNVTVTAAPTVILNNAAACIGSSVALSDATTGGVWSSSASGKVSVDGSGNITGVSTGTATISYTAGGCYVTVIATANPVPSAILGTLAVCSGSTTSLSDATAGGAWSSSGSATVGTSGIVTGGGSAGTASISYTIASTGCAAGATVVVNATPTAILNNAATCIGSTVTLSDALTGGAWSSSNISVASIGSASGTLTGVAGGTATISYTVSGCRTTAIATINAAISAISGPSSVCVGYNITLSDATAGGAWSSSDPSTGSIGSATGIVTGLVAGTTGITYTAGTGCTRSVVITVNTTPTAVLGTTGMCSSGTTTLTDATGGGTWSISGIIATINSTSGLVTASASYTGTATVSYTAAGCAATTTVSVNARPTPVQGVTSECAGLSVTLTDATAGGTWSASGNVTIGSTGILTAGASAGTGTVTYTMGTSCFVTYPNTVYANPTAINGTFNICLGGTVSLTDATSGSLGWSSSNTSVATTINSGAVTGVALGTATITYKILTGGCTATQVITVNAFPVVSAISGPSTISHATPATLSDATSGGVWTSSNAAIIALTGSTGSPITATAVASSGSAVISYAVTTLGCKTTVTKTITASPAPPHHGGSTTGIITIINAGTTSAIIDIAGGIWSSDDDGVATVDNNGVVSGIKPGNVNITHVTTNEQGESTTSVTPVVITATPASVSLLPNPNKGTFMVRGTTGSTADEEVNLEVTNVLGQVIYRNKVTAYGGKINESISLSGALANGMYLLDVNSRTGHIVFHFVIEQ